MQVAWQVGHDLVEDPCFAYRPVKCSSTSAGVSKVAYCGKGKGPNIANTGLETRPSGPNSGSSAGLAQSEANNHGGISFASMIMS